MRVLSLTNTYPPGDVSGVGTLVQELSRALVAAGHEPRAARRRTTASSSRSAAASSVSRCAPAGGS